MLQGGTRGSDFSDRLREHDVFIDDSGVIGFHWLSPYDLTGTVAERAKLLPFKDCTDVFETMVFPVNEWMTENGDTTIQVKGVRLGMSRVTERDARDKGLLLPAWDFFGDVTMEYGSGQTQALTDWPLLTVNAIDGSVIDRNLGY